MKSIVNLLAILGQFAIVIVASSKFGFEAGLLVFGAIILNSVQAVCVYGNNDEDDE